MLLNFFDTLLSHYTMAAIVLTVWTCSAWLLAWVCPQRHIPFWLGINVIFASTGRDEGRRGPVHLDDAFWMLAMGFVPWLNVAMLAFLLVINAIWFVKAAVMFYEFRTS